MSTDYKSKNSGCLVSSYGWIPIWLLLLFFQLAATAQDVIARDLAVLRQQMVQYQIERRGVSDRRVLEAMRRVERHRFVPYWLRYLAYSDRPLPIGEGQTISQPYIVGLMTQMLRLRGPERVLEIGTGSGYQAAVLAELVDHVYTIEIIPQLAYKAEALFAELGYTNITVRCGDGYLGWPEFSPFDAIIVTCAPETVPQSLIEQLAEGGRLVIPVGAQNQTQQLKLLRKTRGRLLEQNIIPVRFVPMVRD